MERRKSLMMSCWEGGQLPYQTR
ncbi:unnamed protein product [Cuscuta europaea]|uniref:Uncharacterized protein n=1 Tax=Cuscuta europaea TaxID=41803 RepID=A0A9P1ECA2_CUSEU|nr:unnamed protein product [Cuscuta europaea]